MNASWEFFVPLLAAYSAACLGWLFITWRWPALWPAEDEPATDRPYADLGLGFLAVVLVFGLGLLWRAGLRFPDTGIRVVDALAWTLENLIIYSPLFVVLRWRKQSMLTIYLSPNGFLRKVGLGAGLGLVSAFLFFALRGNVAAFPDILARAFSVDRVENFVPVFLEGVALAFLFVRLKWALGLVPALIIPSLLFALAHVPGAIEAGRSIGHVAAFFVITTTITAGILAVVRRAQDIIWLGLVHYLMDIAINVF